jgi:competence transcription factor ComK
LIAPSTNPNKKMKTIKPRQINEYRVTFIDNQTMIISSYSSSRARQIAAQMFGASSIATVLAVK